MKTITALSHPNIAFIKYWGNRNNPLRIPANGSISMNLASLETRTSIEANPEFKADSLTLNGCRETGTALGRVQAFMDLLRKMSSKALFAHVSSENNFPQSAGIASSSSGAATTTRAPKRNTRGGAKEESENDEKEKKEPEDSAAAQRGPRRAPEASPSSRNASRRRSPPPPSPSISPPSGRSSEQRRARRRAAGSCQIMEP